MIETTSLNDVQIVCIANLSTASVRSGYDVELSDMESITSRSDLETFVMKMDEQTVERSTQFMMTGYAYDDKNPRRATLSTFPARKAVPPRWSARCGQNGQTRRWSSW